jgi:hypothetical protein
MLASRQMTSLSAPDEAVTSLFCWAHLDAPLAAARSKAMIFRLFREAAFRLQDTIDPGDRLGQLF